MKEIWPWIFGIAIGLIILSMLAFGRSNRQSYWVARKALDQPVVILVLPSDQAEEWRLHHYYLR